VLKVARGAHVLESSFGEKAGLQTNAVDLVEERPFRAA
jgi:hypothetical protein